MEESRKRSQGGENNEEAAIGAKRARAPAMSNETDEKIYANYELIQQIKALLSTGEQGDENDLEAVTVEEAAPMQQAASNETDKVSDAYGEDITAFFSIDDEQGGEDEMDENSDGDCEDVSAWLSIDEEAASELGKLLETTTSKNTKVSIIDDPYYSLHRIFLPSSSYLTINGNEESCGSSYSEKESSVMAGFDIVCRGTVDCCFDIVCGSSYSEKESSVMAGFDVACRGTADCCFDIDRLLSAEDRGACLNDHGEAARGGEPEAQACAGDFDQAEACGWGFDQVKEVINGWDCLLLDDDIDNDDMLARFVGEDLSD